ncbi:MAG: ERAP1-like C-terminal domain-containing protein, partial [Acidobacteriota bacterium]|nr:ERAP1-like C-terminal domain-containing protein [Acidobacteriota bacterium]
PGERDLDITESILGHCHTALTLYLPETRRSGETAKFETLLADRMHNAASLDFRIAYFRAFTAGATRPESVSELGRLLDAKSAIPGLPLQQRDRWNIVSTLVRDGAPGAADLVSAESQRDSTEDGKRSAYAAMAGAGSPEAKARYFEDYLKTNAIPEDFVTASLGSFNAWNQNALTLKFLEPALDALPMLKQTRKIFFINGWLSSFVSGQTSSEAQSIVNGFLARKGIDPDLRLKVLEVRDDLDRTVRIRSRWR